MSEQIERLVRLETKVDFIIDNFRSLPCTVHNAHITELKVADERSNTALARSKISIYISVFSTLGTLGAIVALFLKS